MSQPLHLSIQYYVMIFLAAGCFIVSVQVDLIKLDCKLLIFYLYIWVFYVLNADIELDIDFYSFDNIWFWIGFM